MAAVRGVGDGGSPLPDGRGFRRPSAGYPGFAGLPGGTGVEGHAIVHTVAALPLGLAAYVRLGLRDGPLTPVSPVNRSNGVALYSVLLELRIFLAWSGRQGNRKSGSVRRPSIRSAEAEERRRAYGVRDAGSAFQAPGRPRAP